MKVNEIMTSGVSVCDLNASLADAAKAMWDNDCGILPVMKDGNELVGLITDRDICMGIAMKGRGASTISVEEVMTGEVYSVREDDDLHRALEMMREYKVRRLPVLDAEGKLAGLVSMNDVTLLAVEKPNQKMRGVSFKEAMETYKAICAHPVAVEIDEKTMTATV
ncbi:MAG TPA: CBS domain-containing protein [Pyrinomonadaceae bacterium]|nr:CBS domain-containing protein [Pyrinomonadaceae bacterium]